MKKIITLLLVATFISSFCSATIRRVGYNGVPLAGIDFTTFQLAHDASLAGDTIQLYTNAANSASGTITRRLVILGFGYNFDVHPGLQAIGTDAPSYGSLSFGAGADGSIVTGVSGAFSFGDLTGNEITVSDITFIRCNGSFIIYNYETYSLTRNLRIISSVVQGIQMSHNAPSDYPVENLQVYNSILYAVTLYSTATTASFINCVMPSPAIVGNNYLYLTNASTLIKNSILPGSGVTVNTNTVYENNFFAEAQPAILPPGSNNRWAQDWSVLFNRIPTSSENASVYYSEEFNENYYVLRPGSPAINGGFNAAGAPTNAGIFGGELAYVYKPGGVPAVPSVYELTAPSLNANSNPYNITISVRSNN